MSFIWFGIGFVLGVFIGGYAVTNSAVIKRNQRFERELRNLEANMGTMLIKVNEHEVLLKGRELVN